MNKTWLLFKDELLGFARSWVMVLLWVGLPLLGILMYYILPATTPASMAPGREIPVSYFISLIVASTGGTLAAVLVAVDIVNEKTRKVYDLFVIRPIPRGAIVWAKFFAVFFCVTLACVLSLLLGLLVDVFNGREITAMMWQNSLEAMLSASTMIAVSAAGGVLIGAISSGVLMAVLLVLYGSQNLVIVPMIPTMAGLPDLLWVTSLASFALAGVLMWLSGLVFRKREF